jgi:hypothetical protein
MFNALFLGISCVPVADTRDVVGPNKRRCEALLTRAILAPEEKAQRDLIIDVLRQVSGNAETMSDPGRRRLAFLAGVLIQTSDSFDCRMTMASIFEFICDDAATPGFHALVELYKDAQAFDAAVRARPMVGLPTQPATGGLELLFDQLDAVRPWVRLDGRKK